ncbi:MAG: hypothetical protein R6U21_04090 [Thermoplasmatota archaeon]
MNSENSWDEETYERVFDDICDYIEKRKQDDRSFTPNELQRMIDEAYQRRGMDWIGKGQLQFIIESATIAAFEQKFVEWNKEQKKKLKE